MFESKLPIKGTWLLRPPLRGRLLIRDTLAEPVSLPDEVVRRRPTAAVSVNDPPLAVFPAVNVRDAQSGRLHRAAVPGRCGAFPGNGVGEVSADARGNEVDAGRGAIGELR
jgi:hypothetical protein